MPDTPIPAATVMLLQDGPVSPRVLMLKRHSRSKVLPELYVFPGGRVDAGDATLASRLTGFSPDRLTDVEPELAASFFVAAIRETFEEAGILLARRRGDSELLDAETLRPLLALRHDLQSGRTSFGDFVGHEDLVLAADLLAVHAHWITPEVVPRRFDTVFFTACAPAGHLAHHDGVEASAHVWIRPEDALAELARGERQIIFPTACNLETLAGFPSCDDVLEASRARRVVTVMPVLEEDEGGKALVIPATAGYRTTRERLGGLPRKLYRS